MTPAAHHASHPAIIQPLKNHFFSAGRSQQRGQNFVHLSVEINLFFSKEIPSNTAVGPPRGLGGGVGQPAGFPLTLVMTESVAVNCEARLKVENSISFHCHPREAKFCCQALAVRQSLPSSLATQSCSEAAYRCNSGTAAWAAGPGGCEPQPISISAWAGPPRARCPLASSGFPSSAPARFGKEAGSPLRLRRLGFGRGWGAAEASPRICGQLGSGKVFQSSQQRLPRSPLPGKQTAASAPASPPPLLPPAARSGRLAHSLAGSGPGSRRAGPPTGAKAAADAGSTEGGSRPAPIAQAVPRRLHLGLRQEARGARREVPKGAVRAGGPGRQTGPARP